MTMLHDEFNGKRSISVHLLCYLHQFENVWLSLFFDVFHYEGACWTGWAGDEWMIVRKVHNFPDPVWVHLKQVLAPNTTGMFLEVLNKCNAQVTGLATFIHYPSNLYWTNVEYVFLLLTEYKISWMLSLETWSFFMDTKRELIGLRNWRMVMLPASSPYISVTGLLGFCPDIIKCWK